MSVLDDRDRIARDLHDRVVQRVYAVGLSLQGATRLPDRDQVIDRVTRAIDDLDATISEIRAAIFELGEPALPGGLRHAVLHLAQEMAPTLGFRPEVRFEGPVDNEISQAVGDHVLAVVREGLTNAGKHSGATCFTVTLAVDDRITLQVIDNGSGIELPLEGAGLGLQNMGDRAEKLEGLFEIRPGDDGGTRLVWSVPL
jgi:signal transduction histidine kinase